MDLCRKFCAFFKNALLLACALVAFALPVHAEIASKTYVDDIVAANIDAKKTTTVTATSTDDQYPTALAVYSYVQSATTSQTVTKEQIGLGNVQNVDQTNADNLTAGTVPFPRIPVGTTGDTVATGDDKRFYAVPTSAPSGNAPDGWAWIWIAP